MQSHSWPVAVLPLHAVLHNMRLSPSWSRDTLTSLTRHKASGLGLEKDLDEPLRELISDVENAHLQSLPFLNGHCIRSAHLAKVALETSLVARASRALYKILVSVVLVEPGSNLLQCMRIKTTSLRIPIDEAASFAETR